MKYQQFNTKLKSIMVTFAFFIFSANIVSAQVTAVSNHNEVIGKVERIGLKTSVAFSDRKVAEAWKNYLKEYGKVISSKGSFEVQAAKIPTISVKPVRVISKVAKESENSAYVFCAFDLGSGYVTSIDAEYEAAEKFMKDFALKMYRDEQTDEVVASEKVFNTAQKNQDNLIKKDTDWAKQVQNAQEDIADLEKKIEDRKTKILELNRKVEDNIITKQRAMEELERTRKIVEEMKLKLGEIN